MSRLFLLGAFVSVLLCDLSLSEGVEDNSTSPLIIGDSCMATYDSIACSALEDNDRRRENDGPGDDDGNYPEPSYLGCGCVNLGNASGKVECTDSGQALLIYSSVDCTGTPTTTHLDEVEGCADHSTSAVQYTCNYTGSGDDDDVDDDLDNEPEEDLPCFSISTSNFCDDRRRGLDPDVFSACGRGCVSNSSTSSYALTCSPGVPTIYSYDSADCTGGITSQFMPGCYDDLITVCGLQRP